MKSFGVISELDKSGGLKLPKMLMGLCEVGAGDTLEMHLDNGRLVMQKFPPTCIFCGSDKSLKQYRNRSYCCSCGDELKAYKRV